VKCSFCGFEFKEDEAQKGCGVCAMGKSCGYIRCPRCGYEMLKEATLVKWIRQWKEKKREAQ